MQPKVSVIVPVYNNEDFVVTCLQSLMAQTLRDIEIICINDGSTDNSSAVLHRFADMDPRVRVVDKENGGYGVAINRGLDEATGEYVTILESDDFADLDMYQVLYGYAKAFDLDVVRSNFYRYWASKIKCDYVEEYFKEQHCDRVVEPRLRENQFCFFSQPALWSAIYRTDFIRSNNLRLLETPGAAYQDTAFNFKIWACAKRVMLVQKPFVHYRQDNESSSSNNRAKVFNICIEYHEIDRWLTEDRPDLRAELAPVMYRMLCGAYMWNTERISPEYRLEFVEQFGRELAAGEAAGEIDQALFEPGRYAMLRKTITDPQGFIDFLESGADPDVGLARYKRKIDTTLQVLSRGGLSGVVQALREKRSEGEKKSIVDLYDANAHIRFEPKFMGEGELTEPKISVILTVYNTEDVLRETLDSIFGQKMRDFELIVIDDGSTDGSLDILNEYAAKDARMTVVSQENQGVSSARNLGLSRASAPYTLILDGDDVFVPDMFGSLVATAEREGADVTIGACCEYDTETHRCFPMNYALKLDMLPPDRLSFTPAEVSGVLFEAFMGWPWDRLYRTELLKSSGLTFPQLPNSEDGPFVYEATVRANRVAIVPYILVWHRSNRAGSISNSRLANPEAFYDATLMIKSFLKSEPGRWEMYEKSFLNWAFDYALWNATSLPDGEVRAGLERKIVEGGFPELEIDEHPMSFFDLYPDIEQRYESMSQRVARAACEQ